MAVKLSDSKKGPMADINVTPLIDVVLVLLVVFMVITPMLESGKTVELPQATEAATVNDVGQHVVLSITPDGSWWVEQAKVTKTSLIPAIQAQLAKREARTLLIKGHHDLPYVQVRELLDLLAQNGFYAVVIATTKES